jgi:RNA polymerase sigma-70 factor (ECF subfamily)
LENKNEENDFFLLERLKQDDSKAFENLYFKYEKRLYSFSLKYLKNKENAESLVQDIFTKIWEIRKTLNSEQSFSSFLFTIAKNSIFNKHRKKLNEEAYKEHLRAHLDEIHDKTENDIILADMKQRIDKYIIKLPKKRQEIYLLSREEGLSYKEIAQKLNISEKTIENHIRLVLKDLRQILKNEILFPYWFILPFFTSNYYF